MKAFHLFRVAPVVFLILGWGSSTGFGQVNGVASQQAGTSGASASVNASAPVPVAQMQAELSGKLDSKTAKAGDAVEARTTKTVTMADGTVIPKGSKLMGTVTAVQAQEKGQAESTLGLGFDRVRLRGGQEVRLRSSIDNVSSPVGMSAEDDMGIDDMIGAGPVATSSAVGGRGGVGAGGVGAGGLVGGTAGAVGRTGNSLGSTALATGQGTSTLARGTAQGVGSTVNGSANGLVAGAAQAGMGAAAHVTNVPGVMLSGSAIEGTSGVLSALGKNVHLESGTQMMLSVRAQK